MIVNQSQDKPSQELTRLRGSESVRTASTDIDVWSWSSVVIVGCGLLGASLGLAVKQHGYRGPVIGVARREQTISRAVQIGAIDRGACSLGEAITGMSADEAGAAFVVIAVPLGQFDAVYTTLAAHVAALGGAVITDVGSTKVSVVTAAHRLLPGGMAARFVGSHPMAGSEQQGPEFADGMLFDGKPCITTPMDSTDATITARIEALWQAVGMRVLRMTPEAHDRQTAAISHLPHAAACLLIETVEQLGGWDIASTGLRDTTRLASSNPPMRADIMLANRDAIDAALAVFIEHIESLRGRLRAGDVDTLLAYLVTRKNQRDQWADGLPTSPHRAS